MLIVNTPLNDRLIIGTLCEAELTPVRFDNDLRGRLCIVVEFRTSVDVNVVAVPPGTPVTGPTVEEPNNTRMRQVRTVQMARDDVVAIGPTFRVRTIEVSTHRVQLGFQAWGPTKLIPINPEIEYAGMVEAVKRAKNNLPPGTKVYFRRNGTIGRAVSSGQATFRVVPAGPKVPGHSKPPKHQLVFVHLDKVEVSHGSERVEDQRTWSGGTPDLAWVEADRLRTHWVEIVPPHNGGGEKAVAATTLARPTCPTND